MTATKGHGSPLLRSAISLVLAGVICLAPALAQNLPGIVSGGEEVGSDPPVGALGVTARMEGRPIGGL